MVKMSYSFFGLLKIEKKKSKQEFKIIKYLKVGNIAIQKCWFSIFFFRKELTSKCDTQKHHLSVTRNSKFC